MSPAHRTRADRLRWLWRVATRLESVQVRYLGFSGISLLCRTPVLLLETTGRRSGRTCRTPVAYWQRDGAYVVGGGAGGMTRVDWVANLRTTTAAAVWVRRRRVAVRAREIAGDEYDEVLAEALRRWPEVATYERVSGRPVPYFELRPLEPPTR
jgi:deazaflavin-dependent oxidoreductase (nitroreductase family)